MKTFGNALNKESKGGILKVHVGVQKCMSTKTSNDDRPLSDVRR